MVTCWRTKNSSCEFHRDHSQGNEVEGDQDHVAAIALVLGLAHDLVAGHDREVNQEVDLEDDHDRIHEIVHDPDEDLEDEVGVDFFITEEQIFVFWTNLISSLADIFGCSFWKQSFTSGSLPVYKNLSYFYVPWDSAHGNFSR